MVHTTRMPNRAALARDMRTTRSRYTAREFIIIWPKPLKDRGAGIIEFLRGFAGVSAIQASALAGRRQWAHLLWSLRYIVNSGAGVSRR